jgi:hypothetical protein
MRVSSVISRKKRRKRPEGRGWKSGKRREEEEEEREKERARGREKRYRRQEPVSPYFRFSSFRERSEWLDSALSLRKRFSGLISTKTTLNSVQRVLRF